LVWRAHGLAYGVPIESEAEIAAGRTVLCNLSRGAVAAARLRFPHVLAALVTARPETLAARLAARGRESPEDRAGRLSRAEAQAPPFHPDVVVDNDGALGDAVQRFLAAVLAAEGS
jgi:ribose 1,5-bisphosphokinase